MFVRLKKINTIKAYWLKYLTFKLLKEGDNEQ